MESFLQISEPFLEIINYNFFLNNSGVFYMQASYFSAIP